MKLLTFILFFIIGLDPSTLCQTRDTLVNSLIDNAKILFCNNDTIGTIKALEDVKAKSPDNWILMTTNKTLSDLYLMKGHPSLAIETLK